MDNQLKDIFQPHTQRLVIRNSDFLYKESEAISGIYFLEKGRILLTKQSSSFQETWLGFAKIGSILGIEAISTSLYSHSAKALSEVEVGFVKKSQIDMLMQQNPSVRMLLLQKICKQVQETEYKGLSLINKNSKQRFVMMVLEIINIYGFNHGNEHLNIPLSIREVAGLTGTSARNLLKIVDELQVKGWLKRQGEQFIVLNQHALESSL